MTFCANCGKPLHENDLFCSACGVPQKSSNVKNYYSDQRQNVYVGNVRKCPSCGAELSSFTAICPHCGHELNSVKVPESIRIFSSQLNLIDIEIANSSILKPWKSWSGGAKFGWVVLNIFTLCIPLLIYLLLSIGGFGKFGKLSPIEKKKEAFINNFSFPNDRESVLEALLFIKSQVAILSYESKNKKTKKWIQIWENKAKQLMNKTKVLLKEDSIATDTYNEIVAVKKKVSKSILIKSIIIIIGITVLVSILLLPRIKYLPGINMFYRTGESVINNTTEKSLVPTIDENAVTNEKEGIFSYQIRNYIGKNAASIGEQKTDYLIDKYGDGELRIVFVTEDGLLLGNDNEMKKKYVVVDQNLPAGTTLTVVNERSDDGEIYSYLVSYQSYDEIVLFVAPLNDDSFKPKVTEIKPTLDRHIYHIRDYVGRNAASFGKKDSNNHRIDKYGNGKVQFSFTAEDSSYVDDSDLNFLKQYIVTAQDIAVNSDLIITYQTDSYGNEFDSLVKSQNIEVITLTVKKLDDIAIKKQPMISEKSEEEVDNQELKIKYKVEWDGSATITGFEGSGNHLTINESIDGHKVKAIGSSAFKDCKSLESILCWAEIEKIEDYAFSGCNSLKEISVPNETKTIGNHAFENCTSVEYVFLWGDPDIGEYAFAGCTALKSIDIGNDTRKVGAHAFDGCTNLASAIVWNDNTIIGKDAFANCPKLKDKPIQE
ncbi:leucine-rich repeat protein [Ruminococcus sp.]|uniref:leucine-rich repeat protein n=1 Tax=Ruminococcus sp. TaxID=41978 RepID=UPI002E796393|nr:leucine-rich repeat protein [Ruminococcus sp.]MEE1261669.1 leucine-rich repeat protein [Ruminococcus sp.]